MFPSVATVMYVECAKSLFTVAGFTHDSDIFSKEAFSAFLHIFDNLWRRKEHTAP